MTTTTATRRLAAILAADVVGYSRLMGVDEEGTHERVKAHLREVVEPKIREHHGRIVKTTGDAAWMAGIAVIARCSPDLGSGGSLLRTRPWAYSCRRSCLRLRTCPLPRLS